jgi:hypothetical protein
MPDDSPPIQQRLATAIEDGDAEHALALFADELESRDHIDAAEVRAAVEMTADQLAENGWPLPDGSDGGLAYGGVCPVCGEEFVDGFDALDAGESREARICIVEKGDSRGECLLHLPEEDSDAE